MCAAVGCDNGSRTSMGVRKRYSDQIQKNKYFEDECFERDLVAELLNLHRPKKIRPDIVPITS